MNFFFRLIGTFLMFSGFLGLLAGGVLYRMKQEDLGRLFMSSALMGGGEIPNTPILKVLASMHANEAVKRKWAAGILLSGLFLALLGAAIS